MQIKELMSATVERVTPDTTVRETARLMREKNVGALPVWQNGRLLGIVTDRDICCRGVADGCDPSTTRVSDIMSFEANYCFENQDILDAAHLMEEKHIRRLPVLNQDRTMVGILSLDDIARCSHELAGEVLEKTAAPCH